MLREMWQEVFPDGIVRELPEDYFNGGPWRSPFAKPYSKRRRSDAHQQVLSFNCPPSQITMFRFVSCLPSAQPHIFFFGQLEALPVKSTVSTASTAPLFTLFCNSAFA